MKYSHTGLKPRETNIVSPQPSTFFTGELRTLKGGVKTGKWVSVYRITLAGSGNIIKRDGMRSVKILSSKLVSTV
jgi:hypothetical protein